MCVAFGGIRSCFWTIAFMRCSPRSRICHARPGNCCYQRHGISRLPDVEGDKPAKKKFKNYPIGYFHIDIAEVQTEERKLYLFVTIDRTSKPAYNGLHERSTKMIAADFLRSLLKAVPYRIHTVLTDNGLPAESTDIYIPRTCTVPNNKSQPSATCTQI